MYQHVRGLAGSVESTRGERITLRTRADWHGEPFAHGSTPWIVWSLCTGGTANQERNRRQASRQRPLRLMETPQEEAHGNHHDDFMNADRAQTHQPPAELALKPMLYKPVGFHCLDRKQFPKAGVVETQPRLVWQHESRPRAARS